MGPTESYETLGQILTGLIVRPLGMGAVPADTAGNFLLPEVLINLFELLSRFFAFFAIMPFFHELVQLYCITLDRVNLCKGGAETSR